MLWWALLGSQYVGSIELGSLEWPLDKQLTCSARINQLRKRVARGMGMLDPFLNGNVDQNRPPDLDADPSPHALCALSELRYPNALSEAASRTILRLRTNSRTLA